MGSCLGHCRLAKESLSLYKFYSKTKGTIDIEISELANTDSAEHIKIDSTSLQDKDEFNLEPKFGPATKISNFKRLKSIFSSIRNKYQGTSPLKLELLDDDWSLTDGECSDRTESLMVSSSAKINGGKNHNTVSVNSLDLEWEHLPEMAVFSSNFEKEEPQSATSIGGWSRLSSADSLEWDPAEVEMKEEIDTETEQLLHEIEMLSSKTLKETLEWAS